MLDTLFVIAVIISVVMLERQNAGLRARLQRIEEQLNGKHDSNNQKQSGNQSIEGKK